jgi:hypothetical protein
VVEAQKKTLPSEFNPAIGLVGETIFSYRSKGSDQTGSDRPGGFDVWQRSLELNVAASVDPFAKATRSSMPPPIPPPAKRRWASRKRRCKRPRCREIWN